MEISIYSGDTHRFTESIYKDVCSYLRLAIGSLSALVLFVQQAHLLDVCLSWVCATRGQQILESFMGLPVVSSMFH